MEPSKGKGWSLPQDAENESPLAVDKYSLWPWRRNKEQKVPTLECLLKPTAECKCPHHCATNRGTYLPHAVSYYCAPCQVEQSMGLLWLWHLSLHWSSELTPLLLLAMQVSPSSLTGPEADDLPDKGGHSLVKGTSDHVPLLKPQHQALKITPKDLEAFSWSILMSRTVTV